TCPESAQSTKTPVRRANARTSLSFPEGRRSPANSAQGQRQTTDAIGKKSHGVIEKENANAIAPKSAAARETRSSESQSHVPESARRSFSAPCSVNARPSGSASESSVSGEYAADWPFAASGPPHAFQRLRCGHSRADH